LKRYFLLRKRRPIASAMNLAKCSLSSISLRSSKTLNNVVDTSALHEPTAIIPIERHAREIIYKIKMNE
jgi:hypothetical protein